MLGVIVCVISTKIFCDTLQFLVALLNMNYLNSLFVHTRSLFVVLFWFHNQVQVKIFISDCNQSWGCCNTVALKQIGRKLFLSFIGVATSRCLVVKLKKLICIPERTTKFYQEYWSVNWSSPLD